MSRTAPATTPSGAAPQILERILKDINEKLQIQGILKDRETLNIWTTLMSYLLQGEYQLALPKRQDLQKHMRKVPQAEVSVFNQTIQELDDVLDVYIPPPDLGKVNVVDAYFDSRIQDEAKKNMDFVVGNPNRRHKRNSDKRDAANPARLDVDENDRLPETAESNVFQPQTRSSPSSRAEHNVSKEELFLLKANESVLMKTVEDQQIKIKNLQSNVESLGRNNILLQEEIKSLARDQDDKLSVCTKAEKEIKFLRKELQDKEHALELSLLERNTLLDRLSTVSDARMEFEGSSRAEISDLNRPSQLSDKYSKLFDNEWAKAIITLKDEFKETERKAIITLLDILYDAYSFCLGTTESHTKNLSEILLDPFQQDDVLEAKNNEKPRLEPNTKHLLVDLKRSVGKHAVTSVQKEFLRFIRHTKPGAYTDVKLMTLRPYIGRCVELCWSMVLQSPPLSLDDGSVVRPGEEFDRDTYRFYNLSGSTMDYIVWPALFTSRNGLVLCRGIAQPKPEGIALRINVTSRSSVREKPKI